MPYKPSAIEMFLECKAREDQKEAAKLLHDLYKDFIAAGFSEDQSFEMIKEMLTAGMRKE